MRSKWLVLPALVLMLVLPDLRAFAQRGGGGRGGGGNQQRGGGNQQRGGSNQQRGGSNQQRGGSNEQRGGEGGNSQRNPYGGGGSSQRNPYGGGGSSQHSSYNSGGFGGGFPGESSASGSRGGSPSMGPYGHGGSTATKPGMSAAGRPETGGAGGPNSGVGVRPGAGAGQAGVGGPDSGVGVRPGAGAGRAGVGAGGVGGPDSGVGVLPGAGAGRPGTPATNAYGAYGTRYAGDTALAAQRNVVVAGAGAYPRYDAAAYARYPNAWQPTNLANASLYANPGYGAVAGMMGGMGMGAQPMPYDYGGNVVAQPNAMYVNGEPAGTPQQYAQQAGQIAATGAGAPDPNAQWQPLGIFAMVLDPQSQDQPNDLFQLVVNNQGTIRGNYHDVKGNTTTPLAGAVDPKSQRAAWTIGGAQSPVYEAGIANLTRDQTTMVVHAPDGRQFQYALVRLPDPQAGGDGSAGAPAPGQP